MSGLTSVEHDPHDELQRERVDEELDRAGVGVGPDGAGEPAAPGAEDRVHPGREDQPPNDVVRCEQRGVHGGPERGVETRRHIRRAVDHASTYPVHRPPSSSRRDSRRKGRGTRRGDGRGSALPREGWWHRGALVRVVAPACRGKGRGTGVPRYRFARPLSRTRSHSYPDVRMSWTRRIALTVTTILVDDTRGHRGDIAHAARRARAARLRSR